MAGPDEGTRSIQYDQICTRLVQEAACVDAVAAYVDVAGFLFNVVKEDVQSNQRDQNLTTALDCAFKYFER